MLTELEPPVVVGRERPWTDTVAHVAWLAWIWFVGVSVVGFWLVVAATVWLDARPFGRVVIEWGTVERAEGDRTGR